MVPVAEAAGNKGCKGWYLSLGIAGNKVCRRSDKILLCDPEMVQWSHIAYSIIRSWRTILLAPARSPLPSWEPKHTSRKVMTKSLQQHRVGAREDT